MSSTRTIHAWLGGQLDNVGDSVLRRGYVRALHPHGRLRVWADGDHPDYVSALGLEPGDEVSPTFLGWVAHLAGSVVRTRPVVAVNAGEFTLTKGYFLRFLAIFPVLLAVRLRGGRIVWLGAAVPAPVRGFTPLFRTLARLTALLRWRDEGSSAVLYPAPTMPDWAFSLPAAGAGPQGDGGRPFLTVTLRGDRRAPTETWLETVRETAERLDLQPVVVVQVQRDAQRSADIARTLGALLVEWKHDAHDAQEQVVREVYASSAIVLSDRLHALIIGVTEGAVPLGWCEAATDKLRRNFAAVGLDHVVSPDPSAALRALDAAAVTELQAATAHALEQAEAEFAELRGELARVLAAPPGRA